MCVGEDEADIAEVVDTIIGNVVVPEIGKVTVAFKEPDPNVFADLILHELIGEILPASSFARTPK